MKYSDAPLTLYNVQPNKRYRFRIINAAFNVCPFQIQIERHNFTIIESDGEQMEPVTVDTLYFLPGERYDIIVHTAHEVRDYWIRVTTLFPCINTNTIEGFAVLRYHNKVMDGMRNVNVEFVSKTPPLWNESFAIGNMFNTPQPSIHGISIAETQSHMVKEHFISSAADQIFYLIFDTPLLDNQVLFTTQKAIKFMGENVLLFIFLAVYLVSLIGWGFG
jgi:FtsP/CotA-like multicopper oxidase with cupredoxin domain